MQNTFEPIQIYREFERLVREKGSGVLDYKNLDVQAAMFSRLIEPDDDSDFIFASISSFEKEPGLSLGFSLKFHQFFCELEIEGFQPLTLTYESGFDSFLPDEFKDEKDFGLQLFLCLQLLANGHMAVLTTMRYGRPCASELLLREGKLTTVLATITNYRWWWSKKTSDLTGYSFILRCNEPVRTKKLQLPSNFFLIEKNRNGKPIKQGREISQDALSPLTKGMYYEQIDSMELSQIGKEDEVSLGAVIYKSWEFYALFILLIALIPLSDRIGLLPPLLSQHWALMILPFFAIDGILLALIFYTKKELYKENPEHPWFKLDTFFSMFFWRTAYAAIVVASIGVTFMPNVVDSETKHVTTLFGLAYQYPAVYLAMALLFCGILEVISQRKLVRVAALLAYLFGNFLLWFINEAFTDNTIDTPEPYTSITIGVLITGFVYTAVRLIRNFRSGK